MKFTFYGHSAGLVEAGDHRILFDPFLQSNPLSPVFPQNVTCDTIILTHGHEDHFGDTVEIAKANDATVVATVELARYCASKGVRTHEMNIGGEASFPFGTVKLTPAWHSSSLTQEDGTCIYLGMPTGVVLKSDRSTLYHAGDTALFGDMKLIGEMNSIDLALVPIGDNYTMGVSDAAEAVGLLRPRKVVPIHYNTFPLIEVDPQAFAQRCTEVGAEPHILEPGASIEF
jgi:L-ascorbate metabolism protein UlaG (beta-lactamase superfamily)